MKTRNILLLLLGLLSYRAAAQMNIVMSKKVYVCTKCESDTFQTASDGCRHWASKHLEAGYYSQGKPEVQNNGAVKCICKKAGAPDNDQQGNIAGVILCPDHASVVYEETTGFDGKKCQCDEGYVAAGNQCLELQHSTAVEEAAEPGCDQLLKLSKEQVALRNKAVRRLQEIVSDVNKKFAQEPSIAAKLFDSSELKAYADVQEQGKGFKWYLLYGQAVERLAAEEAKKDPFLKTVVIHIPNKEQIKKQKAGVPADNMDFKGTGALSSKVCFDVTTPGSVFSKMKEEQKKCWEFITYERLINLDGSPVD